MEEDYHKALDLIFAYGYECCMFKHNICKDQPEVPDCMPDSSDPLPLEFFANPRCPSIPTATEATTRWIREKRQRNPRGVLPLGILLEHLKFPSPRFFLFFFFKFI